MWGEINRGRGKWGGREEKMPSVCVYACVRDNTAKQKVFLSLTRQSAETASFQTSITCMHSFRMAIEKNTSQNLTQMVYKNTEKTLAPTTILTSLHYG